MNQEEALLESLRRHDDGLLMSSDRKWIRGVVLKTFTSLINEDEGFERNRFVAILYAREDIDEETRDSLMEWVGEGNRPPLIQITDDQIKNALEGMAISKGIYETDKQIAKRMWEKYLVWVKEKTCLWNNTMIINGYTEWLQRKE